MADPMKTIASNEEYVRLRIYEGDLKVDDAAAELLRMERAQHAETRRRLEELQEKHAKLAGLARSSDR